MKPSTTRIYILAALVLSIATSGWSDTTFWNGSIGHVDDPANWSPGFPDNSTTIGEALSGQLIGSGNDFSSKSIMVVGTASVNITNDLTMTDGQLALFGNTGLIANGDIDITLGSFGSNPSDFTVMSLSETATMLLTAGDLTLGGDSDGGIVQTGGTVQLANGLLTLGAPTGAGNGIYDLAGGKLQVNDLTFTSITSYIDLSSAGSGVLEVSDSNYSIATAEANISNGLIRRDGVTADKSLFSITSENGFIKVQAIPEPTTLGLIGFGGLSCLIGRRLSKKIKGRVG